MQTTALGYLEFESLTHQRPDPGVLRDGSSHSTLKTSGGEDAIPATITTTLYDLIAGLQDVVQPGEDALVMATMVHLLCTGRITWLSGIEALESVVCSKSCLGNTLLVTYCTNNARLAGSMHLRVRRR